MKLIILVPDGMPDWRYAELGDRSPAEYAETPGMDELVRRGKIGLVQTMYAGLPLGSLVGILGILGYNPPDYFPMGRSIFEALARGITLHASDICCRCNIVRVSADDRLLDFTAGQITDADAYAYLAEIKLHAPLEIHHDLSYRNVLVYRDTRLDVNAFELSEPHENVGKAIEPLLPRYGDKLFEPFAQMMRESRRDGLMLWPWGPGRTRVFPPVRFRLLTITALSFLSGLGISLGGQSIIPHGATGYLGSNLAGKLDTLKENFSEYDVFLLHCNAPDEEGHIKSINGKAQSVADIDQQVVVPLLKWLEQQSAPYRVLLCPDHYTVTGNGKHTADLVPFAIAGTGLQSNHTLKKYSEVDMVNAAPPTIESKQLVPIYYENKS